MPQDTKRTGTLAAQNDTVVLNHPAISTCAIQITGTFVGTVVFEADVDEGSSPTYVAVKALDVNSGSLVASATAAGLLKADVAGYRSFRVRCSAYTSGSIAITLNATEAACAPGLISAAASGAGAVTVADGANIVEGSTTDLAVTGDNAGTVSAKLRGLNKLFADVWDSVNHWLQVKVMAALPTGANVIGAITQSGTWTVQPGNTANTTAWKTDGSAVVQPVSATALPLPTGAAADATLGTTNTEIGGLTETAPATDIASSGLNGRLQRVAQRLTSLIALLPTALVSNRLDVNLGAAPATVTIASPTVVQGAQNAAGAASWNVQGAGATGAAVSGNPVLMAGWDGTNAQNLRTAPVNGGSLANTAATAPLATHPFLIDAANVWTPAISARQNLTAAAGANFSAASKMSYNGANFDVDRGNTTTVVQASGVTTVQTINTDITNYNGRAFMAHANVTLYNGGSILMKLQMKDANGLFTDIPGATTGTLTSGADVLLNVGPTVWPANTATMFNVNFFLPRLLRLVTVIATASVTFSQSYDLPAN